MLFVAFLYMCIALIAALAGLGYVSSTTADVVYAVLLVAAFIFFLVSYPGSTPEGRTWYRDLSTQLRLAHFETALELLERWRELRRKRQGHAEPEGDLDLRDIALKRLQRWDKSRPKRLEHATPEVLWAHLRNAMERLERWEELRRKRQRDSESEGQITTESSADLAQTKDQPIQDQPQIGR